jgi:hypothetical protein
MSIEGVGETVKQQRGVVSDGTVTKREYIDCDFLDPIFDPS